MTFGATLSYANFVTSQTASVRAVNTSPEQPAVTAVAHARVCYAPLRAPALGCALYQMRMRHTRTLLPIDCPFTVLFFFNRARFL